MSGMEGSLDFHYMNSMADLFIGSFLQLLKIVHKCGASTKLKGYFQIHFHQYQLQQENVEFGLIRQRHALSSLGDEVEHTAGEESGEPGHSADATFQVVF